MPHTDALVVLTTVATPDAAETLLRALLERRLVACGSIVPGARSLYHWEGRVADEREVLVVLKTRTPCLPALEAVFADLHPYVVPELLALPVVAGGAKYLDWLRAETPLAAS
jgi:periplasmic divalent cation tolerance protein